VFALGEMNMTEDELYDITPRAFSNKAEGYNRKVERERKAEMELHRESIITFLSPHLDKRYRNKSPKQLYPLPWDVEVKPKNQTKDPIKFWEEIDAKTKK